MGATPAACAVASSRLPDSRRRGLHAHLPNPDQHIRDALVRRPVGAPRRFPRCARTRARPISVRR